jgi:hypothetical protein
LLALVHVDHRQSLDLHTQYHGTDIGPNWL